MLIIFFIVIWWKRCNFHLYFLKYITRINESRNLKVYDSLSVISLNKNYFVLGNYIVVSNKNGSMYLSVYLCVFVSALKTKVAAILPIPEVRIRTIFAIRLSIILISSHKNHLCTTESTLPVLWMISQLVKFYKYKWISWNSSFCW